MIRTYEFPAGSEHAGRFSTRAAAPLAEGTVDLEARTFELSIASEIAVLRWGWELGEFDEVLLCGPDNVDLSRMAPEAAGPLLLQHDHRQQIGVIDSARVDGDRVLRGVARVQRSPAGDQLLTDIADRIKRNASVGYSISRVELHEEVGKRPRVVVTRWAPHEVSIVAAGADPTVGVGRSTEAQYPEAILRALRSRKGPHVDDDNPNPNPTPTVDVKVIADEARKAELARIREITAIGERFDLREDASAAIGNASTVDAFRQLALDKIEKRQVQASKTPVVDLSNGDRKRYSLGRAAQALLLGKRELAPFECEVSDAYEQKGVKLRSERGIYVPMVFMQPSRADRELAQRVLQAMGIRAAVSKGGTGGNLIATDNLDEEFVPHLLSDLVVVQAGARVLPGLVGDIDIPAGDGSYGTATHISSETGNAAEIAPALRQITGRPKTAAGYTDFTRRMRLQSVPAIEAIVRAGLVDSIQELVERSVLNGSGSGGAPTGLYGTTGVNEADFGGAFNYLQFLEMWAAVKNAKGSTRTTGFITSYGVAVKAMSTTRGGTGSDRMIAEMIGDTIRIDAWPLYATQESPQTFGSPADDHGVAFGDWSRIVIPSWGEGVELNVDEAALALSGGRRLIAFYDYDVMVTLNKSFAVADDVVV